MTHVRGKQNRNAVDEQADRPLDEASGDKEGQAILSDLARRAVAIGLSGFFFTESTIRKALGDTLPKEWADFAAEQSDRTRAEFVERLSYEIGRAVENLDYAAVLAQLLEGRTLEVSAKIRLHDDGKRRRGERPRIRVEIEQEDEPL